MSKRFPHYTFNPARMEELNRSIAGQCDLVANHWSFPEASKNPNFWVMDSKDFERFQNRNQEFLTPERLVSAYMKLEFLGGETIMSGKPITQPTLSKDVIKANSSYLFYQDPEKQKLLQSMMSVGTNVKNPGAFISFKGSKLETPNGFNEFKISNGFQNNKLILSWYNLSFRPDVKRAFCVNSGKVFHYPQEEHVFPNVRKKNIVENPDYSETQDQYFMPEEKRVFSFFTAIGFYHEEAKNLCQQFKLIKILPKFKRSVKHDYDIFFYNLLMMVEVYGLETLREYYRDLSKKINFDLNKKDLVTSTILAKMRGFLLPTRALLAAHSLYKPRYELSPRNNTFIFSMLSDAFFRDFDSSLTYLNILNRFYSENAFA